MKKREREFFLSLFLVVRLRFFSSTSREESTNFFTISSSLSHQLHERKASTSSHFYLHFFINFTTGKASTSSHFLLHFFINFTKGKYQLLHNFIFTFSSTSRKESINFNTFSHFFLQRFFSYLMRACEHQDCLKVCLISDL